MCNEQQSVWACTYLSPHKLCVYKKRIDMIRIFMDLFSRMQHFAKFRGINFRELEISEIFVRCEIFRKYWLPKFHE